MKDNHLLIHRDFGDYVIEFCAEHLNCSMRKIYGMEAKKWQDILNKVSGGD